MPRRVSQVMLPQHKDPPNYSESALVSSQSSWWLMTSIKLHWETGWTPKPSFSCFVGVNQLVEVRRNHHTASYDFLFPSLQWLHSTAIGTVHIGTLYKVKHGCCWRISHISLTSPVSTQSLCRFIVHWVTFHETEMRDTLWRNKLHNQEPPVLSASVSTKAWRLGQEGYRSVALISAFTTRESFI